MGARISFGGKDSVGPLVDALNRRLDTMETKLASVGKQSKATRREAEALWRQAQSPADRYNETLRKARMLLDGTAEGQRKYDAVVRKANDSLTKQRSMFGSAAVSQLMTYAQSMVGVSSALSIVTSSFREMDAARTKAAEGLQANAPALAELAQLSGGDPRRFAQLREQAQRAFRRGAAETAGGAARLQFALRSAGVAENILPFYQQLAQSQAFGDVAELARSTAAIRSSLGTAAGPDRELISQALAASQFNPQGVAELMRSAARGGPSARQLGISPAGLLAMTAVGATATGTSEQGATLAQAFMRSLERAGGFEGMGAIGVIQQVRQRVAAGEDIRELLGARQEAVSGFRIFANNLDTIRQSIEASRRAVGQDLVGQTAGLALGTREQQAVLGARRAQAGLDISRSGLGVARLREEAAISDVRATFDHSLDPFTRAYGNFATGVFGRAMGMLGMFDSPSDPGLDALNRIRDATESTETRQGDLQTVEN